MKRICIYWLCIALCCSPLQASEWDSIESAFRNATETREDRLAARVAELEAKLKLSTPEVTHGWLTKTRRVFSHNQRYCQIVNGQRYCWTAPVYVNQTYREWGPVASSQRTLLAEASPTPMKGVARILNLLAPQKSEVFVDFGCGHDARFCITASKYFGCRSIGIEIDHGRAESARRHVVASGLQGLVTIIEGDATKLDVQADVGVAYLYPDTLDAMLPKIKRLDRFASYLHKVKGLPMRDRGGFHTWHREKPTAQRPTFVPRRYAVWNGHQYAGRVCRSRNCRMCNSIQRQLGF